MYALDPHPKKLGHGGSNLGNTKKIAQICPRFSPSLSPCFSFPISLGLTQIFKRKDATSAQTSLKLNTSPLFFIGQMRQTKGAR